MTHSDEEGLSHVALYDVMSENCRKSRQTGVKSPKYLTDNQSLAVLVRGEVTDINMTGRKALKIILGLSKRNLNSNSKQHKFCIFNHLNLLLKTPKLFKRKRDE